MPLHEDAGLDARVILVANHDERRHLQLSKLVLKIEKRRTFALDSSKRQRGADGGVLVELVRELLPSVRVLAQELYSGRAPCVVGHCRHALLLHALSDAVYVLSEALGVGRAGARPGDYQGPRHVRVL